MNHYIVIDSPIDPLTLVTDGEYLIGLYMSDHINGPIIDPNWTQNKDSDILLEAGRQLTAYFAGELRAFSLPLRAEGTDFQRRVWAELSNIPYATTISYGELAVRIGNPAASRAVGLANGRNPISIVVPCHRVIGANGKLVGFGGGLNRKAALLALEQSASNPGSLRLDL